MNMLHVLLVEDNRADVMLVQEAFAAHSIQYQLHVVKDGQEAMEFVERMGKPGEAPCPDLLLLDLNLPKTDGTEVLRGFRSRPECATTPVIVITSSEMPRDRERVSAFGVVHYFRKPTDYEGFIKLGAVVKEVMEHPESSGSASA